jgi:hypothetical protein
MAMARSYAVTRSAYVALRFTRLGDDVMFQIFVDGNRNGVRTRDIGSHVDSAIGVSARLSELFVSSARERNSRCWAARS